MKTKKLPPELKDLEAVLSNLDFVNNFNSFEATLVITAGQEVRIRNQLNPIIPSKFIVCDAVITTAGTLSLTRGAASWTTEALSIKNSGTGSFTIKLLFLE